VSGPVATSHARSALALGDPRAAFAAETSAALASAAREGLLRARKRLPPWVLYDDTGSALFEEITRLPEYYLSRAEREILRRDAGAILDAAGPSLEIIELGAGSASKTKVLLAALLARQPRVRYVPVDVSPAALEQARAELRGLRHLEVVPVAARYPEELGFLRRSGDARRLVLFMGSNIGNYDLPSAQRLLAGVRRHLAPGDALLVGADRRKSAAVLVPAYDDAEGVTARFNKNGLARLNRELGATFDLDRFRHVARWNGRASRIEIYLESTVAQRVLIPALHAEVSFAARERIHTEWSYKLTGARMRQLLARAGFAPEAAWTDTRRWFGVTLARVPRAERRRRA
jgi:dimethylhistidine N-methyltransferase